MLQSGKLLQSGLTGKFWSASALPRTVTAIQGSQAMAPRTEVCRKRRRRNQYRPNSHTAVDPVCPEIAGGFHIHFEDGAADRKAAEHKKYDDCLVPECGNRIDGPGEPIVHCQRVIGNGKRGSNMEQQDEQRGAGARKIQQMRERHLGTSTITSLALGSLTFCLSIPLWKHAPATMGQKNSLYRAARTSLRETLEITLQNPDIVARKNRNRRIQRIDLFGAAPGRRR